MDWTELIDAFLAAKQRAFSPNTRRAYRYDLMACAQVLPTLPIREITVSHLRLFLDATTDLAPTTLARRKAALRSCFNWAYQQDLLDADPTAKLEAIPIGERHPRPLTEKQVEAILAAIPRHDLRNRLLVTLLYETGMRVGEALGLQVQQVHLNDLDGGYLRIVGEGNKERVIPLIDASRSVALLRNILKRWAELVHSSGVTCAKVVGMGRPSITVPSGITSSAMWSKPALHTPSVLSMSTNPLPSTDCATPMRRSNCVMGSACRRCANCWGTPTCRLPCAIPRSIWRRSSANWWKRVNGIDEEGSVMTTETLDTRRFRALQGVELRKQLPGAE